MAAKIAGAVAALGLSGLVLLVVVLAGAAGQAGTTASAAVVVLDDLAAQSCVGLASTGMSVTSTSPASGISAAGNGVPAAQPTGLSQVQAQNADAIIAVADSAGTGDGGAVIAVMVAVTESSLESTATNGDHIGLFQQSPSWGTAAQRLDPTTSAALFIERLTAVNGWQQMSPWVAAQVVQASQFDGISDADNGYSPVVGANYQANYTEATQIVGVVDGDATDAGCGQQQGALPADPTGEGGLPASYVIPPGADPVETKAVTFALSKVGGPYVWGGNGPSGYDCSGLVNAAWAYAGVTIPRTSQAELGAGSLVASVADISPGDLVLVPGSGDGGTLASPGHVALYIGDGLVVAAADTQVGIIVQTYSSLVSGGLSGIRHIA
jgi:cell wall-associated NlpC family hydrolase